MEEIQLLTVKRVLEILTDARFIYVGRKVRVDARFDQNDPPLHETAIRVGSDFLSIDNETFGKRSMLYFHCVDADIAQKVAEVLQERGGKPSFDWCFDDPRKFEMQVSYFKGHRWWE